MKRTVEQVLADCDKWDAMMKQYGLYGMAKKIMKLPSYRTYTQKYPYDYAQTWDTTPSTESLADFLVDEQVSIEEEVSYRMIREELEERLTARESEVFSGLISGMSNTEVEAAFGFNTNNAVRWHKHKIKNKYYELKNGTVNEYICKECAWQWRHKNALNCPKCDSRDVMCTRKDIPVID